MSSESVVNTGRPPKKNHNKLVRGRVSGNNNFDNPQKASLLTASLDACASTVCSVDWKPSHNLSKIKKAD